MKQYHFLAICFQLCSTQGPPSPSRRRSLRLGVLGPLQPVLILRDLLHEARLRLAADPREHRLLRCRQKSLGCCGGGISGPIMLCTSKATNINELYKLTKWIWLNLAVSENGVFQSPIQGSLKRTIEFQTTRCRHALFSTQITWLGWEIVRKTQTARKNSNKKAREVDDRKLNKKCSVLWGPVSVLRCFKNLQSSSILPSTMENVSICVMWTWITWDTHNVVSYSAIFSWKKPTISQPLSKISPALGRVSGKGSKIPQPRVTTAVLFALHM